MAMNFGPIQNRRAAQFDRARQQFVEGRKLKNVPAQNFMSAAASGNKNAHKAVMSKDTYQVAQDLKKSGNKNITEKLRRSV